MKALTGKDLVQLFKKQPVGITCALVSLVLLVTLYFRWDTMDELEKQRDENKARAELLANNLNYARAATGIPSLQEQYTALVAANKAVEERAVKPTNNIRNIQYFSGLEDLAGVKDAGSPKQNALGLLIPGAPGKTPPKTTYGGLGFAVYVQGEFRELVDLLRRVERGPHFSRIAAASVGGAAPEGEQAGKLTLQLSVELFALRPPAP